MENQPENTISVEEFVRNYSGVTVHDRKLLFLAMSVEGNVGAAARAVVAAERSLAAALEAVGFEVWQ